MERESRKPKQNSGVLHPDAPSGDPQQSKAPAWLNIAEEQSIYTSKETKCSKKLREVNITSKKQTESTSHLCHEQ